MAKQKHAIVAKAKSKRNPLAGRGRTVSRLVVICFCAALLPVVVLWVRSYRVLDILTWNHGTSKPSFSSWTDLSAESQLGTVTVSVNVGHESDSRNVLEPSKNGFSLDHVPDPGHLQIIDGPSYRFSKWGFVLDWWADVSSQQWGKDHESMVRRGFILGAPYWFLTGAMSFPVLVVAIRRFLRRRRSRSGRCAVCGYDLRATPERCPECGAEPKAA